MVFLETCHVFPEVIIQKRIISYLKKRDDEIANTLSALIRIPTVNPYSGDSDPAGESRGQAFIARRMRRLGGVISRISVPSDVYKRAGILAPRERDWKNRRNVVGRFRFGRGGDPVRVVLNGHMDTVGVNGFDGDPFSGERRGGRLIGRGASDCKGGLIAGLFAIQALKVCRAPVNAEILFESVVDEECNGSGAGTLAACMAGVIGDYCILLDGMSGLIYTSCRGVATVRIAVRGRAGHGAAGGVSAVEKLILVKRALDGLGRDLGRRKTGDRINVGVLRAGSAPWTVPDSGFCVANITYGARDARRSERAGKGYNSSLIRQELEKRVDLIAGSDKWLKDNRPEIEWIKDLPPGRLEDSCKAAAGRRLLDIAAGSYRAASGKNADIGELSAWSDYSHLVRLGGMPAVGMGTGEPGASHTATEFTRVANVRNVAAAVALSILQLQKFDT